MYSLGARWRRTTSSSGHGCCAKCAKRPCRTAPRPPPTKDTRRSRGAARGPPHAPSAPAQPGSAVEKLQMPATSLPFVYRPLLTERESMRVSNKQKHP
jgi:hypothetical protein